MDYDAAPLRSKREVRLAAGLSTDHAEAWLPVWVLTGRRRRPRVTVTAGVHGDEFEGVRAIMEIAEVLAPESLDGTLVLAPIVNPYAYRAGLRSSPIDGLNLNRVFPGDPLGLPSERLAHLVMRDLILGSDCVIDLHSGGTKLLHAPIAGYYGDQGDVGVQSHALAAAMGLPYVWNLPRRPGVLSFEAVKAGIPALGTEIGGAGRCLPEDVVLTRRAVLGALQALEVLAGQPVEQRRDVPIVSGDWSAANASGLLDMRVALGDHVSEGQLLGRVLDPFGRVAEEVRAAHDGTILGLRSFPSVNAGELIVFLPHAGERDIAHASSG